MPKYTLALSKDQEKQLDLLQVELKCTTRAEVFRKAINLASLVAEMISKGQTLAIEDHGKVIERIRVI